MESGILQSVLSRLYELEYITATEKENLDRKVTPLEVKGGIYDLLSKRDLAAGIKILKTIQIFDDSEGGNSWFSPGQNRNPMQIDMIVKVVFGFLNLKDIKSCRLVCRKWSDVSEPLLRKRSKVVFHRSSQNTRKTATPEMFNETFKECGTNVPFTSFSFSSWDLKDGWTTAEMTNFFQQQGNLIEELEFHNMIVRNDRESMEFDIGPWIKDLPLKKLIIDCFAFEVIVPLYELQNIEKLRIRNCKASIKDGISISPVELQLEYVTFCRDEKEMEHCHLNDYIDFKKAENILIHSSEEESSIGLNLNCIKADELDLKECRVQGWGVAKGNINKLNLVDVPLTEKTKIKIKELNFQSSTIDLASLPREIEKLSISGSNVRGTEISCTQSIYLSNLTSLKLTEIDNLFIIYHFRNCRNLTNIHVCNSLYSNSTISLDLKWIPQSVKRLKFGGPVNIQNTDDDVTIVDTLILDKCSFLNVTTVLMTIKPRVLVVTWEPGYEINDTVALFRHQFSTVQKFYVGPFNWEANSFSRSLLALYVDQESSYYVFEDQRGKSININEFNNLVLI